MPLAIVKSSVNFQSHNVAAPSRQLILLHPADFVFWKKDIHLRAFHAIKAGSHGTSGVAGGGCHHFDIFMLLMGKTCQQPCHKSCAHVFKSKGRAVKKLETKDVFLYFKP